MNKEELENKIAILEKEKLELAKCLIDTGIHLTDAQSGYVCEQREKAENLLERLGLR